MKGYADKSRKNWEFQEGDFVWLRLKSYRQNSVENRCFTKLSKRYYGPYKITKKINPVAYRLDLPATGSIFPVFHIALLKPFVGKIDEEQTLALPPKAWDAHPIVVPTKIIGYRISTRKGHKTEQVLIEWEGL